MTKYYKDLDLVVTAISKEITLGKINPDGMLSHQRRNMTDECIKATTEWFMRNEHNMTKFKLSEGNEPTLFYTSCPDKSKKILKILEEV